MKSNLSILVLYKLLNLTSVQLVIFEGLDFCGLESYNYFVSLYFCGLGR